MTGDKQVLRQQEKDLKKKISEVPDKYKPFWQQQLKEIRKQLYGHS